MADAGLSFQSNLRRRAHRVLSGSIGFECQVIEYRHGESKNFSTIKIPGITKIGNVTLKKGVFPGGNPFWDWYGSRKQNEIQRQTVVIELLDEKEATTMKWTLTNAWPTKVSGTDLKSESAEVVVHTIELAFESLTATNG